MEWRMYDAHHRCPLVNENEASGGLSATAEVLVTDGRCTNKSKRIRLKMRQLRCIATYSRRLGAPQNICHLKLHYAATGHV